MIENMSGSCYGNNEKYEKKGISYVNWAKRKNQIGRMNRD
jgi:hypothetical protein